MTTPLSSLVARPLAQIGSVVVHAEIKTLHTRSALITDHAVETGSDITDNARPEPDTIQIEGMVSAAPLDASELDPTNLDLNLGPTTAAETMRDMVLACQPIDIVTAKRTYRNMLLFELQEPSDASVGDDFVFSVKARSVRLVSTDTVAAPVTKLAAAKGSQSKGNQPPVDPDDGGRKATFLRNVFEDAGVIPKGAP